MLLAFDTSGPHCTAVLAKPDGSPVALRSEEIGRGHAEHLVGLVDEVLSEGRLDWHDIERVGCTTGPGSFTGLRVGLAAAQGLTLALNKPGVGVSVFEVLARACAERVKGEPFCIVQDARREQVYVQAFDGAGRPMAAPSAHDLGALEKVFPVPVSKVAGTGANLVSERLAGLAVIDGPNHPLPQHLASACMAAPATAGLKPLYLRAADAKPQKQMTMAP
ncbi:MAG: tRNA (adenosine(37)-N6)-threonylcarbamoyltransferase complex dimerization subunit type 1 TsaB [Pseudomonadota bacterium]